jgi:hypothetical protein
LKPATFPEFNIEFPHVVREHMRDSPKVNVWCGLMHDQVIGPFFFQEQTVNMYTYLDMLRLYAIPQFEQLQPHIILQQDGAPPRWFLQVSSCLDRTFLGRWIGRDSPMPWPPCSPDITPFNLRAMCFEHQLTDLMTWGTVSECDLGYSIGHAPQNMARARISSGRYPYYQGSPHRGLLRSVKSFQSFSVICHKLHVASSICLRAKNFSKPRIDFEDTL